MWFGFSSIRPRCCCDLRSIRLPNSVTDVGFCSLCRGQCPCLHLPLCCQLFPGRFLTFLLPVMVKLFPSFLHSWEPLADRAESVPLENPEEVVGMPPSFPPSFPSFLSILSLSFLPGWEDFSQDYRACLLQTPGNVDLFCSIPLFPGNALPWAVTFPGDALPWGCFPGPVQAQREGTEPSF